MSKKKKHVVASDRLYHTLKSKIVSGEYCIGEKLTINKLAKRNKVSHTPVREVLQRLSHDGLVDLRPHEGAYVRKLSIEEALEIAEIRLVLEQLAVRWLAEQGVAPDTLEIMQQACIEYSQAKTYSMLKTADLKLHELFLTYAGKGTINRILHGHTILLSAFRNIAVIDSVTVLDYAQEVSLSTKEHIQILEAIKDGDPDRAVRITEKHLTVFIERLKERTVAERREPTAAVNSK